MDMVIIYILLSRLELTIELSCHSKMSRFPFMAQCHNIQWDTPEPVPQSVLERL